MAHAKTASSASSKRVPPTLVGTVPPARDDARSQAIAGYEAALALLHQGKFPKAKEAFIKMLDTAPPDIAERIRMNINLCLLQVSKGTTTFQTHEERYDCAISLMNTGHYEDAREHFREIQNKHPEATYVYYGMAVLASMTGESSVCLSHLAEAIRHDPRHRIQARADSDFQNMADDPRFTELLYPEA
jgi:tetratricopeptide (TPR) repeat protein